MKNTVEILEEHGIRASVQRIRIADEVLYTEDHPSADIVWQRAKKLMPVLSRATVYNTLNLFVKKGLLRELILAEGKIVFDPKMERHHHFINEKTGRIMDIPWEAVEVRPKQLKGLRVSEYQVVLRGSEV
mgnify:CR=1 FL=1